MATVKKLFSLDSHIAKELEIVAEALQISQKEVLESALDFYFDYTDGLVADKVTQSIRDGDMKVLESAAVYKELGIEL